MLLLLLPLQEEVVPVLQLLLQMQVGVVLVLQLLLQMQVGVVLVLLMLLQMQDGVVPVLQLLLLLLQDVNKQFSDNKINQKNLNFRLTKGRKVLELLSNLKKNCYHSYFENKFVQTFSWIILVDECMLFT